MQVLLFLEILPPQDFKDGYKFQWTLGTKHGHKSVTSHQSPQYLKCHSRAGQIERALVHNAGGACECIQSNGPLFQLTEMIYSFPEDSPLYFY